MLFKQWSITEMSLLNCDLMVYPQVFINLVLTITSLALSCIVKQSPPFLKLLASVAIKLIIYILQ